MLSSRSTSIQMMIQAQVHSKLSSKLFVADLKTGVEKLKYRATSFNNKVFERAQALQFHRWSLLSMMACKTKPCLVLNLNSLPEFLTKSSALTLWCSWTKLFFDCLAMSNQLLNGRRALVVQNFDSADTESKGSRGDRTRAKSKYQCSHGRKGSA